MDDYLGMVKLFVGNYAPVNWAFCNGQLLPVPTSNSSPYLAIFSLLQFNYGGDGRTTFALPNLQSRIIIGGGMGKNPAFPDMNIDVGDSGGSNSVLLNASTIPPHSHTGTMKISSQIANTNNPNGASLSSIPSGSISTGDELTPGLYTPVQGTPTYLNLSTLHVTPGTTPHPNMMPYVALSYIICMNGYYPPRP